MNKVSIPDTEGPSVVAEETHSLEEAQYINNRNFGGFEGYRGEGKPSFEDLVGAFVAESGKKMARTESRLHSMETHIGNMGATMKSLETQIGQLANALRDQNRGQFPSNTEVNPKEQCKAVTLRSGKELDVQSPKKMLESEKSVEDVEFEVIIENKVEDSKTKVTQPPAFKPAIPYHQRFKKKSLDDQFAKFLEIFKKIHINIPFADALEQMPNYAKFIKDVMSKKRKLQEFETVKLTEECRASINLMPFSIFRKLELGEVKPTTITLQLADRNMEEDNDAPLIFGRPFLATGRALIDVHKGELTLRVGGEEVIFNIYHAMKGSNEVSTCKSIDVIDSCVSFDCGGIRDPLESCLVRAAEAVSEDDWEVKEQLVALEVFHKEKKTDVLIEELNVEEKIEVISPSPDLKELPSHLCYAFLGEKSTYPVIISSSLTIDEKYKLLRVLREYKTALGWSISDIRGISPTICMHKILMEESYTLYVDHQRRLNPAMKEVVKNEVLKLLNAGYNQIAITPEDQEKTTFTCPYGTFAFRRMPFGLCNAPATFQRCMMRCQEKNLVLNWEKCHFMVQEGIVLGHKVSSKGLEVDRTKVVAIEKLPPPKNIKGIRSFLGHAGFYRRFIKDFSKITKPLCNLLEKDSTFIFDDDCLQVFEKIKRALVTASIMIVPDWK
ncbi:uncharacterized protein [Primulina eburnea]|uniref:uncharacterized protein n=1 Tax=Primulina eburnea TaxID=1245227 RepID=UPI003C6C53DE